MDFPAGAPLRGSALYTAHNRGEAGGLCVSAGGNGAGASSKGCIILVNIHKMAYLFLLFLGDMYIY